MSKDGLNCTDHGDGIVEICLSRNPVNALSAEFLLDVADCIETLEADPSVRALVFTSPFKVFSAGLDLKEAQNFDLTAQHAIVKGLNISFLKLFACPKPTIVAVDGAAIAGGLFFVLASDFRIASQKSSFGLAEVRVGADFPVGPLEIARATLGPNDLRRLMLTGQPFKADMALKAGIVDEITDNGSVADRAIAVARNMARIPPKTYASVKKQIRGDVIALINKAIDAGANTPDGGWFSDETVPAMKLMIG